MKAILAALVERELGDGRPVDPRKAVDRLLARTVKARRDDDKELREAAIRAWVDRAAGGALAPAFSLEAFAERVLAAARAGASGRFGADKVFIVHLWRAAQDDPALHGMGLDAFKRRLGEANNARLLDLSRADLVEAMDPADVAESETHYHNATFHFVRIPEGAL